MDGYLAIWSREAAITPATVAHLNGARVDDYWRKMSVRAIHRDKLAFVRQWPIRRYAVVPGTVSNECDAASPAAV